MEQAKKDDDEVTDSITEFFMDSAPCQKSENGYYKWKCVSQKCKDCKDLKPLSLKCKDSCELKKVGQFEKTKKTFAYRQR